MLLPSFRIGRHGSESRPSIGSGKRTSFIVLALGLLCPLPVSAGQLLSVRAKNNDFGNFVLVDVKFNNVTGSYYSGIQEGSLDGGQHWFDTYCVDLYHDNFIPVAFDVTLNPIAGLSNPAPGPGEASGGNGDGIGFLYDSYASDAETPGFDRIKAAALQVAIWTVEYGGAFQDTDTANKNGTDQQKVAYQANQYLSGYNTNYHGGTAFDATWFKATSHGPNGNLYQDLVGPIAAPEPPTLLAGVFGMLTCLALWRRRAVKAA